MEQNVITLQFFTHSLVLFVKNRRFRAVKTQPWGTRGCVLAFKLGLVHTVWQIWLKVSGATCKQWYLQYFFLSLFVFFLLLLNSICSSTYMTTVAHSHCLSARQDSFSFVSVIGKLICIFSKTPLRMLDMKSWRVHYDTCMIYEIYIEFSVSWFNCSYCDSVVGLYNTLTAQCFHKSTCQSSA